MEPPWAVLKELKQLSNASIAGAGLVLWIIYLVGLAIYRLYLSPLAKFPGPKLAALTKWYEIYYEVVQRGQFTFHFNELHEKYGEVCLPMYSEHSLITQARLFALPPMRSISKTVHFSTHYFCAPRPIDMPG